MRQSGCASWLRRTWHAGWVLPRNTAGLNARSVLSRRPHGLGPGCGPLSGGPFRFGSRASPGFLKGSKQGRWPRLLAVFLVSFPFSVGPRQAKALGLTLNLTITSCLLFSSLQEAKCHGLWGNWSFLRAWWQAGAAPLHITLYKVSIQRTRLPRPAFSSLSQPCFSIRGGT